MGMGFAPTWLRQVSPPPPASQNHFNHCERWVKVHCMIVALGMFQAVSAAAAGASRKKHNETQTTTATLVYGLFRGGL